MEQQQARNGQHTELGGPLEHVTSEEVAVQVRSFELGAVAAVLLELLFSENAHTGRYGRQSRVSWLVSISSCAPRVSGTAPDMAHAQTQRKQCVSRGSTQNGQQNDGGTSADSHNASSSGKRSSHACRDS
jgi:hypothetical protein